VQRHIHPSPWGKQRREERPGADLRDLHRDIAGRRRDQLVAGAVTPIRAGDTSLVRLGADERSRFGIDKQVQNRRSRRINSPPSELRITSSSSSRADWSRAIV